ncbi:hypothetical protein B0J17DRAFT_706086 [Rhizoctonia solani]|nr:hypothetical protein B0J17DRAFT_706086 [Rhizoctonia solani]
MARGIKFLTSLFRRTESLTKRSHAAAQGAFMTSDYVPYHSKGFAQPHYDTPTPSASSKAPTACSQGYMTGQEDYQQTYVSSGGSSKARMGSPNHERLVPVQSMNVAYSYASAEEMAKEKTESDAYAYPSLTSPHDYPHDSGYSHSRRAEPEPSKVKGSYRATPSQLDGPCKAEDDFVDTSDIYNDALAEMPAWHQSSRAVLAPSHKSRTDRNRLARLSDSSRQRAGNVGEMIMRMGLETETDELSGDIVGDISGVYHGREHLLPTDMYQ